MKKYNIILFWKDIDSCIPVPENVLVVEDSWCNPFQHFLMRNFSAVLWLRLIKKNSFKNITPEVQIFQINVQDERSEC